MGLNDKWAELWVEGITWARCIHIVLTLVGYAVMAVLVLLWLLQYCPLVLF